MSANFKVDNLKRSSASFLRVSAYLLMVTLVFSVTSVLCNTDTIYFYRHEEVPADLTGVDFSKRIVSIAGKSFTMYPGAFYLPEDFAEGKVKQSGIRYNSAGEALGDHGTLRLELRLPPSEVYAVASQSVSYAQRLFINGREYASIGRPGTSTDVVIPKSMRYMETFSTQSDISVIVIHYSALVHADGGGLYSLELGLPQNIARAEQLRTFRIAAFTFALITAMLFFFGLFLFFRKRRYFLWFSLACGSIAMRGLLTGGKAIMLLLPNLNWYSAIRLEYLTTCGTAFFSALYLSALFPREAPKWAMRGYAIFCALNAAFVCLTQPFTFTGYASVSICVYILFSAYLLLMVLISVINRKKSAALSTAEQMLLLAGFLIYLLLSAVGIYAHRYNISLWGMDYPQVGMMMFLFINILTLTLDFARTERKLGSTCRELDATRRSEREMIESNRMLEEMYRVKSEFLGNISHELRTPLELICGSAGLTATHIERGIVSRETLNKLDFIQNEAMRLAKLTEDLLRVSLEKEWQLTITDTDAETLLKKASDFCAHICRGNGNKILIQTGPDRIPLRINADGIHQVLINLIMNANKHTHVGMIVMSAKYGGDGEALFTVSDNGVGIPRELMPDVFVRGVSGDGGNGLGLAICKRIVNEHRGKIGVESASGVGTTVYFTLPCAKAGEEL